MFEKFSYRNGKISISHDVVDACKRWLDLTFKITVS
jgi:hypothetical protein